MSIESFCLPSGGVSPVEWCALYTRHQHEKAVARILKYKGYEIFLPLIATRSRWTDRAKVLSLPLFPCYVFLKGGLERRVDLLGTPGIYGLVSSGSKVVTIPSHEIEGLQRAVESGVSLKPHPFLNYGDLVRIKHGPLVGVQGFLVRKKNLYRLVLSVEILGKAASLEVDALLLEKVTSTPQRVRSIEGTRPSERHRLASSW